MVDRAAPCEPCQKGTFGQHVSMHSELYARSPNLAAESAVMLALHCGKNIEPDRCFAEKDLELPSHMCLFVFLQSKLFAIGVLQGNLQIRIGEVYSISS